jgi:superfamily II DNA or RNA helicase
MTSPLNPGIYEALITARLEEVLRLSPESQVELEFADLSNAEAADRVSRHLAQLVSQAIESFPDDERAVAATRIAEALLGSMQSHVGSRTDFLPDLLVEPAQILESVLRRRPDGSPEPLTRPLTPLLDTTVLTNAPGEPAVAHELRAEVPSADEVDVLVAFIRWTGIRGMLDVLRRHCEAGRPLRVLTTIYTNSTEQRALDELVRLGADVRISYDTTGTRLHAKAWLFHRESGYSTAYLGSSNLTQQAQFTGLEWNVRLSQARNPDALAKMKAVFDGYWASPSFVPYDPDDFRQRTAQQESSDGLVLSPIEVVLRPFQEVLLDQLEVSRDQGHHRNLLVAATGTGKTVMAAVDYVRLRSHLPRARLLFVAHREEILDQSRNTFRHALRDAAFGEKWVGSDRPQQFEHVFASIQSLRASGVEGIEPDHFDVVIVDEFHHAAAPSYAALLDRVAPRELLGLTATPERADGLDILKYFGGRIAAELRLWDAIDQQYLVPFDFFGVHDGLDLREIPWRRGRGYDLDALSNVLTADHVWANRVLEQVRQKIADPHAMRALGFCVSIAHARFMAQRFQAAGLSAKAIWGDSPQAERQQALRDLGQGKLTTIFAVDLFNEGVDVPDVDTLLLFRPTESPTLFLQQLGRGLRKAYGKSVCTVLDFIGLHRKEFRYDRSLRALLGGSRKAVEAQVEQGFPFLPAGCSLELDPVARDIVLKSIRNAIPSQWRDKCRELQSLGDVTLGEYLENTGLDLEDVYTGTHGWSEMRRAAGLETLPPGPNEATLLRAVGRMTHVDDAERIEAYRSFAQSEVAPQPSGLDEHQRRLLRMFASSLTSLGTTDSFEQSLDQIWKHPQVLAELVQLFDVLPGPLGHVDRPLALGPDVPIRAHARYTRLEILSGFGVGSGARPMNWQSGVLYAEESAADLFAFTLDKTSRGFSPTTRYRDYAISPQLIHWESQSNTALASPTGQRYIHHRTNGSHVVLFARQRADQRALWCLGTAQYRSHEGERPIAFVWELDTPLPAELFTVFAAAVA